MRIIAKLLLLSLEEDEEVVLNAVMSALGSFENKTQLKEEIACEKLAFAGMEIDASKRLVYRGEKEVNITFTEFEILHLLAGIQAECSARSRFMILSGRNPIPAITTSS